MKKLEDISLCTLLYMLGENSFRNYLTSYEMSGRCNITTEYDDKFEWYLFNEDGTERTLYQQSQETIDMVHQILDEDI